MAALAASLVAVIVWALPARPYEAPWAWISFIGMCIIDDFLLGARRQAQVGQLPKVALLAAVIVFRRHPELTLLIAGVAAPLSGALKGQRWTTVLTATAQWVLAAILGAAGFRLVGRTQPPCRNAGQNPLHPGRNEALVGHPAELALSDARIPHLRRVHPRR